MSDEYRNPNSWIDRDGHEWCYACKGEVYFFKEGWVCDCDSALPFNWHAPKNSSNVRWTERTMLPTASGGPASTGT